MAKCKCDHSGPEGTAKGKCSCNNSARGTGTKTFGECCRCWKTWCPKCGLPKCKPTRCTFWPDGSFSTEYNREYYKKKAPANARAGKKGYDPDDSPFFGNTEYKDNYLEKPFSGRALAQPGKPLPNRPFEDGTTYRAFYTRKDGLPRKSLQKGLDDYSPPFQGISTNNADYVPWDPKTRKPFAPDSSLMAALPFRHSSTYNSDYIKKPLPLPNIRPVNPLLPSVNTQGITEYGHEYIPRKATRGSKICCDVGAHLAEYRPSTV